MESCRVGYTSSEPGAVLSGAGAPRPPVRGDDDDDHDDDVND